MHSPDPTRGYHPESAENKRDRAADVLSRGLPTHNLREDAPETRELRLPAPGEKLSRTLEAYGAALCGESEAIGKLRSQVKRIAPYFRTALVTGPLGTGKEAVARMLHAFSPGSAREFIACEASALAEAMLRDDGRTVLEAASGGTLFLEDAGEVPPALQGALLRIWSATERGKLRVVAGTHRNLRTMSVTGQLRPDLLQRLTGVELAVPALRDRREDLPEVVAAALRRIAGDRALSFSAEAYASLLNYDWPGNFAELEKALWSASNALTGGTLIGLEHLPELRPEDASQTGEVKLEKLQDVVQQHVLGVLTRCGGNKLRAAEMLGISRSTLYRMLDACASGSFSGF